MLKKTLLLFIIFTANQNNTMYQPRFLHRRYKKKPQITYSLGYVIHNNQHTYGQTKNLNQTLQTTFPTKPIFSHFAKLLPEMQRIIIEQCINITLNPYSQKYFKYPKAEERNSAIRNIKSLALVNRFFYKVIDDYSDEIIDMASKRFYCAHETVALRLQTPQSRARLNIQNKLKNLCIYDYENNDTQLKTLIAEKVNINFVYFYKKSLRTPLMIAAFNNIKFFRVLLDQSEKTDVNKCLPKGHSILHCLTNGPYKRLSKHVKKHIFDFLLKQENINVNLQTDHGETPLLLLLTSYNFNNPSATEIYMINALLEKGADPTIANKWGLTPMTVATTLDLQIIVTSMEKVIKQLSDK